MITENLLGVIGLTCFGILLIILAFTKWCKKGARCIVIVIGIIFVILGLSAGFGQVFIYALVFGGSFGTVCVVAGGSIVLDPFRYRAKRQGEYIAAVSTGSKYHLVCQYEYAGKIQRGESDEEYSEKEIEKYFKEGDSVDIWVNEKKPGLFRRKRFHGFVGGIVLVLFGLLMLHVPVQVWKALH